MRGTGKWVEVLDEGTLEKALDLCKGEYQRRLVLGYESLSGSTLRGLASRWNSRYAESRDNLLHRLRKAGIPVSEKRGPFNRRILVIGSSSQPSSQQKEIENESR